VAGGVHRSKKRRLMSGWGPFASEAVGAGRRRMSGVPLRADIPSFPPPRLGKRSHRGLAHCLVAVRRRAVLVLSTRYPAA
jgi:hypothetical protein